MSHVIVGFVADLMFQTRVESVAQKLGYQLHWIEAAGDLPANEGLRASLGEQGLLADHLSRLNPDLLIFDLGNAQIPWERWIPALKTVPATRRFPLICFGSHVDVESLKKARQFGADAVVARSRFVTGLPALIQKYARQINSAALLENCAQPLPFKVIRGLELFNQGDFFAAHEWLEEAWIEDRSVVRDLYRGILQAAVAYFHISRNNYRGAVKMFQRARYWLAPLPEICRGVDVAAFRAAFYTVYDQVLALGPDDLEKLEKHLLKPIRWFKV